jgi:hypothetical protein
MKIYQLAIFALLISGGLFITACNPDPQNLEIGTVTLEFENVFNEEAFAIGSEYTIANGDVIKPSKLLYYISNVSLSNDDGSTTYEFPNNYYLVDAANAASLNIDLEGVPNGNYTKVNFTIGVDSTRNVSGAQEGALAVENGMFWSWNMGYIFMKMEGTVQDTTNFRYHIGGFTWNTNNVKTVSASVPTGSPIVVNGSTSTAHFMVDFAEYFKSPVDLDVAATPIIMSPNAASVIVAENYKDIFMIHHVHNE